jgi:hypothetical protein
MASFIHNIFKGNSDPAPTPIPGTVVSSTDRRTQTAIQSAFSHIPEASLPEKFFASVFGGIEGSERRLDEAISKLPMVASQKPAAAAQPAPAQLDDEPKEYPTIYILPAKASPVVATPPAATPPPQTALVPSAAIVNRPSVQLGASRAAAVARTQQLQSEAPSFASRALSLIQSKEQKVKDIFTLLEKVVVAYKERKKLIAQEVQKLKPQHQQYNFDQIYALYRYKILMSPSILEQTEKLYQNYTTLMQRVKELAQEKGETFIQDVRTVLMKNLSNQAEREEFEATLVTVKAQHYFASYDLKSPGPTCLENFADHFEEEVRQALEERLGPNPLGEHFSELKKQIEDELLWGAVMVPAARESVALYRPQTGDDALIAKRKMVVKRLRDKMSQSHDLERKHSESLSCLNTLSPQEREAYLRHVGVQDSKEELAKKLHRFGS